MKNQSYDVFYQFNSIIRTNSAESSYFFLYGMQYDDGKTGDIDEASALYYKMQSWCVNREIKHSFARFTQYPNTFLVVIFEFEEDLIKFMLVFSDYHKKIEE